MKSVASAPAKTILFGEHFVVYGYDAILCAIDKRVTVKTSTSSKPKLTINSQLGRFELDASEVDCCSFTEATRKQDNADPDTIPQIIRPIVYIVKNTLEKYNKHIQELGVCIDIESDIPVGVGLGSSSATYIATAASVSNLFGKTSKQQVLDMAIRAEREIFQNVSGADAAVSLEGGMITYNKNTGYKKMESRNDFQLLIVNSRSSHTTRSLVDKVSSFKQNNEEKFKLLLKEEMQILDSAKKSILNNEPVSTGKLMLQNHSILRKIGVSNEYLDKIVKLAELNSYGGKLTGAGGGGCVIVLVDSLNREKTMKNLINNHFTDYFVSKIDNSGLVTHSNAEREGLSVNKDEIVKENTDRQLK